MLDFLHRLRFSFIKQLIHCTLCSILSHRKKKKKTQTVHVPYG